MTSTEACGCMCIGGVILYVSAYSPVWLQPSSCVGYSLVVVGVIYSQVVATTQWWRVSSIARWWQVSYIARWWSQPSGGECPIEPVVAIQPMQW